MPIFYCSQGLDDEVPEFSFVNLFCFVDLSFGTSRGTFPFFRHMLSPHLLLAVFLACPLFTFN